MKTIASDVRPPKFTYSFPQNQEKIAFFDIETTGLSAKASSLYLIGVMYYDTSESRWQMLQWFADNYQSEKAIIQTFLEFLENYDHLYHFNGCTFDIPYILHKCDRYAIRISPHNTEVLKDSTNARSIDLLKHIRPLRRALLLEKCSQNAVEHWLGCRRTDTFDGGELIAVYSEYMQQKILAPEKSQALEQVLLLHNHDDLEMMLEVCSVLSYEEYLMPSKTKNILTADCLSSADIQTGNDTLTIAFDTSIPVPRRVSLHAEYPQAENPEENDQAVPAFPPASLVLDGQRCTLTVPLYRGFLKYFYPNPKDYYYLPNEDMAVHRSVAEFVEKEYRQKATAATCYTKKEGTFLPCLTPYCKKKKNGEAPEELPHFFLAYRDKLSFYRLPDDHLHQPGFWQSYLTEQFCAFL